MDGWDVLPSVVSAGGDVGGCACPVFEQRTALDCCDRGVNFFISDRTVRGQLLRVCGTGTGVEGGVWRAVFDLFLYEKRDFLRAGVFGDGGGDIASGKSKRHFACGESAHRCRICYFSRADDSGRPVASQVWYTEA